MLFVEMASSFLTCCCSLLVLGPMINWEAKFCVCWFIAQSFWSCEVSREHSPWRCNLSAGPGLPENVRLLEGQWWRWHCHLWVSADSSLTVPESRQPNLYSVANCCTPYDLSLCLQLRRMHTNYYSLQEVMLHSMEDKRGLSNKLRKSLRSLFHNQFKWCHCWPSRLASPSLWKSSLWCAAFVLLRFVFKAALCRVKWQLSDSPLELIQCTFPCHRC